MEPFQQARQIEKYKRKLGMKQAGENINGKIWYFVADNIEVEVLENSSQQGFLKLNIESLNVELVTTLVYAKCKANQILKLWEDIYLLANRMTLPWIVGVILIQC